MHPRFPLSRIFPAVVLLAGCASDSGSPGGSGQADQAVSACFFTDSAIRCAEVSSWSDDENNRLRTRVEDFYPSACADRDSDGDRVPDFLDDDSSGDDGEDHGDIGDEIRCRPCNRGPGNGGDFRLEIEGDRARLDRGRVYLVDGDQLTVPTPEGALVVEISATTRIDDGVPSPGAEIRAEGVIGPDGELLADRVTVLCQAPAAMPPDEVPDDSEPVVPPVP